MKIYLDLAVYIAHFFRYPGGDYTKKSYQMLHFIASDSKKLGIFLIQNETYFVTKKEEHKIMAKRRKRDFGTSFINYKPNKTEKGTIKAVAEDYEQFAIALGVIESGEYKLSLTFDDQNECFGAYLTPRGDHDLNSGFTLASKHSNPIVALTCVLYYATQKEEWKSDRDETDVDW